MHSKQPWPCFCGVAIHTLPKMMRDAAVLVSRTLFQCRVWADKVKPQHSPCGSHCGVSGCAAVVCGSSRGESGSSCWVEEQRVTNNNLVNNMEREHNILSTLWQRYISPLWWSGSSQDGGVDLWRWPWHMEIVAEACFAFLLWCSVGCRHLPLNSANDYYAALKGQHWYLSHTFKVK